MDLGSARGGGEGEGTAQFLGEDFGLPLLGCLAGKLGFFISRSITVSGSISSDSAHSKICR